MTTVRSLADTDITERLLVDAGVRPGMPVFQEHDATIGALSRVALPQHAQVRDWMWRTVTAEGANMHVGFDLHAVLTAAGLIVEAIRAEAIVQTPTASHASGSIVRAMLPRIIAHGVATAAEVDVDLASDNTYVRTRGIQALGVVDATPAIS
jgi:hypothetical protein